MKIIQVTAYYPSHIDGVEAVELRTSRYYYRHDIGVTSEVKQNNAGLVIPTKDSKAIANSIIGILSQESPATQMGYNNRMLVMTK
jgi:hypothetical protein